MVSDHLLSLDNKGTEMYNGKGNSILNLVLVLGKGCNFKNGDTVKIFNGKEMQYCISSI